MIQANVGEYVVGAYLKVINGCNFVDYNVRPPGGGLEGLQELDVVGLDFERKVAYLCEVTTHIRGLLYRNNRTTVARVRTKHERQRQYAERYLAGFPTRRFMFWSPVVPRGYVTDGLAAIEGLELVINEAYAQCIDELRREAGELTNDIGNPFFRALQILEHLRR